MKTCVACKIEKELDCFNVNKAAKDGLQRVCKECNQNKVKSHYYEKRQLYIAKNKRRIIRVKEQVDKLKTIGCQLCLEKDVACIDFHHIESDKKEHSVGILIKDGSTGLLRKELIKCCLLCSNCHRKLHRYNQQVKLIPLDYILILKYLPL